MKRLLFALLLATLTSCCAAPGLASAHVLKIDGDISAILHINPDDYATSGHPTSYTLWFDDSTGHFTLPACNCTATVRENSQTLSTAPLSITHSLESDNTATFPKPDVYTLQITGRPKRAGAFQPFTLSYLIRVQGGAAGTKQSFPFWLAIGLASLMALIMLGGYAQEYYSKDKRIPRRKFKT